MAISKRMRFEILRRDGFRCFYCGATPTEAELHVDHVVPQALGGTDDPENLVTSCQDCNEGKSSTTSGADLVAAVNEATAIALAGRKRAAEILADRMLEFNEYEDSVIAIWEHHVPQFKRQYTPGIDVSQIANWHALGVSLDTIEFGIRVAMQADHVAWRGKAGYAVAVIKNKLNEARDG